MAPDFSGWATKNDLLCSDGRVIRHGAFDIHNGQRVPLVWQHGHGNIENVIGHAELESRDSGVYAYGYLNTTPQANVARDMLEHGDINALSIFANKLKQQGNNVIHGNIVEVSLVLSGANPGALIENVTIQHSDGTYEPYEDEAIIHSGFEITMEDPVPNTETTSPAPADDEKLEHADTGDTGSSGNETLKDIYDSLTPKQKDVVHYMLAAAAAAGSDSASHDDINEGETMAHSNVFDNTQTANFAFVNDEGRGFTHSELDAISDEVVQFAMDNHVKLSEALSHADKAYGISNVEMLFPNAKVNGAPSWVKPEDAWVADVVDSTSHTPFARLKSMQIDLTEKQLRAKGYITASEKKEGVFKVLSRETTPQTIYVKSKLDRDDIIDVTEHDIVAYTKEAMRIMFRYELARAILIGDGRDISDADKIKEDHVRPIYSEDDFYASKFVLPSTTTNSDLPEKILRAQKNFKGHGVPTLFTTYDIYMDMLLTKDETNSNRRLYRNADELCAAMHVSKIVVVDELEGIKRTTAAGTQDLIGIVVNINDYNIGRDKGGDIFNAEDFDIDFNQYKYLMETRLSGALTEPKTAIVVERLEA